MGPDLWFHRDEIFELLSKWPSSHSVTPDFIPLHLIKRTAHYLAFPLELLFNLSYMRSEVPSRWKHSFIVPVPKKPPFSNPSNYRPISITSVFARLFEKIVKGKVTAYMNRNRLIPTNQHGFSTRAIDHIVCWSENWGLPLAADKTKVFKIGNERFSCSYKIGSVTLESVQEIKDLGFIFSNKLGFKTHYKS
ncbi:hypothetical protein COOONC_08399, partial [Cooperia oncophora]